MSGLKKVILSVVAGAALSSFGFFVLAQGPAKPQTGKPAKISDNDLKAFVKFYVEYQKIQQQYGPSLTRAKEPEKRKIQDEANTKVVKAMAKQNLTAQEYNRIFKLVNEDEGLRKKALKLIEEERKRS